MCFFPDPFDHVTPSTYNTPRTTHCTLIGIPSLKTSRTHVQSLSLLLHLLRPYCCSATLVFPLSSSESSSLPSQGLCNYYFSSSWNILSPNLLSSNLPFLKLLLPLTTESTRSCACHPSTTHRYCVLFRWPGAVSKQRQHLFSLTHSKYLLRGK